MEAKNRILRSISPTATLRSMKPGSGIEIPCSAMSFSALIMAKARLNRQSGHNEWQVRVKNDAARGKCYLVERGLSGQGEVTTGNSPQQPTTGNYPQLAVQPATSRQPTMSGATATPHTSAGVLLSYVSPLTQAACG